MDNPDVVLEIDRDEKGNITQLAYKVHTREDEGKSALELCSIASGMFEAEGRALIDVSVEANILGGIT